MSTNTKNKRASLHEWQVEQLRLTAFPSPSVKLPDVGWWENVVGRPPEARTSRPKTGELKEEGTFETGVLVLSIQPLRIDWRLAKAQQEELIDGDLPVIGEFPNLLESLIATMQRWLEKDCPEITRLAFGVVLLLPVENRQAGYERLSAYLHDIRLDPVGSSDFLYQINRSRSSGTGIQGLQVNRLSKWSVFSLVRSLMLLSNRAIQATQLSIPENYACRLELDINTAADFSEILARDKLLPIFREFVELAKEIVEKGDVP